MNALSAGAKESTDEAPDEWKPTSSQGLTTWCPAEVFVQDGRAVTVQGNRYAKHNDGKMMELSQLTFRLGNEKTIYL